MARHALISMVHNYFDEKSTDHVVDSRDSVSAGGGVELAEFGKRSAGATTATATGTESAEGSSEENRESVSTRAERNIGRTDQAGDEHEVSWLKHTLVTLVLWGSTLAIGIGSSDLKIVLALTGSLAASMLGYIIPAALYFKTYETELMQVLAKFDRSSASYENLPYERVMSGSRFMIPLFMIIFGFIAMFSGLGTTFYDMAN